MIAQDFVGALKGCPDEADVVAVGARSAESAQSFIDKLALTATATAHQGYKAVAEDPNVDVVYIATLPDTHYELASMCIRCGPVCVRADARARVCMCMCASPRSPTRTTSWRLYPTHPHTHTHATGVSARVKRWWWRNQSRRTSTTVSGWVGGWVGGWSYTDPCAQTQTHSLARAHMHTLTHSYQPARIHTHTHTHTHTRI